MKKAYIYQCDCQCHRNAWHAGNIRCCENPVLAPWVAEREASQKRRNSHE